MSIATVITEGYSTFGNTQFIVFDGYGNFGGVTPPTPPPIVIPPQPSGGWPTPGKRKKLHLPTYPTDAEIRKQREDWGILPKTAAIISAVAQRQAEAAQYDEQRYFEELSRELQLQGIEWESKYLELLNTQRVKLIDAELARLLKIQIDNEDMEIIIAITMAAL